MAILVLVRCDGVIGPLGDGPSSAVARIIQMAFTTRSRTFVGGGG
jgi:hypothetical protein